MTTATTRPAADLAIAPDRPAHGGSPTAAPPDRALPVLLAALFVVTLDFFIVNVALPSMQRELHASEGSVTVWVAGYAIAFSAFLVLGARLGDRLGRRRMFVWGLGVFTAASAVCGVAPSAGVLAVARLAQGLGAALVSPQVLSTITATTDGPGRVRAMTAYGLTAGVAAISGQLVGGALIAVDLLGLDWRTCFLVNVPIGAAAMLLAPRLVPETRADRHHAIDPLSVVLLSLGLAGIVLPLAEGRSEGWPAWCVGSLAAGGALLAAFGARQHRLAPGARAPLVDLRLLRGRTFGVGTLLCFVLQTGVASSFFVLALALQGGSGLSALQSGLVFAILAVGYVGSSIVSPQLVTSLGRNVFVVGAGVSVVGEALLAATAGSIHAGGSVAPLVPGLALAGIGMGCSFSPSVTVAVSGVTPELAGEASGVVNTVQQAGGAVGVALLGIVFYGALGANDDVGHAFRVASWCLAGQTALVGVLALGLPRRTQSATAPATDGSAPAEPAVEVDQAQPVRS